MSNSEQPLVPLCAICKQPLQAELLNLNRRWHWECERCSVCNQSMSGASAMIESCLAKGKPVAHTVCSEQFAIRELREKKLPYTLQHIQAANNEILTIRHAVDSNEASVSQLFELLKTVQEYAANISNMLQAEKAKIGIANSREYQHTVSEQKKARATESEKKAKQEIAKAEKQALRAAERENPELKDRRVAIESLMKNLKMDLESATRTYESMLSQVKGN